MAIFALSEQFTGNDFQVHESVGVGQAFWAQLHFVEAVFSVLV
ncbi:hypothetical protein [Photorhabdus heterorhabditis]|nr:hypothetical protein [Photorhabdus heterorhabditis]